MDQLSIRADRNEIADIALLIFPPGRHGVADQIGGSLQAFQRLDPFYAFPSPAPRLAIAW